MHRNIQMGPLLCQKSHLSAQDYFPALSTQIPTLTVHKLELNPSLYMRHQREDLSSSHHVLQGCFPIPMCCPHKPDNYTETSPPAHHGPVD